MGSVMPKGAIIPRAGHKVHVTVGLPLDVSDLTPSCAAQSEREQHQVCLRNVDRMQIHAWTVSRVYTKQAHLD